MSVFCKYCGRELVEAYSNWVGHETTVIKQFSCKCGRVITEVVPRDDKKYV